MNADTLPVLIIDAGAAIALGHAAEFDRITSRWRLAAPRLFWAEISSVLHREGHRRPALREVTTRLFEQILLMPVDCIDDYERRAPWDLAELLGWRKTYDAEYLAAARSRGAGILSFDDALRRGADRLGIEVVRL